MRIDGGVIAVHRMKTIDRVNLKLREAQRLGRSSPDYVRHVDEVICEQIDLVLAEVDALKATVRNINTAEHAE